jgi:2'-5' RNA ligase
VREYVTTVLLDDDGRIEFDRAIQPLHVTISTNFRVDLDVPDVLDRLRPGVAAVAPLEIVPGGDALFGPAADLPVVLVEPRAPLLRLHLAALAALSDRAVEWMSPYLGEDYVFHSTVQRGRRFGPDPAFVDRLALVEILKMPTGDRVRVVGHLALGTAI